MELEQIKALESHSASHDVLATLFCLAKQPDCEGVGDFAAQQNRPRTIQ